MRIAVPRETTPGERRVALVPENVTRLVKQQHEVAVERGAGAAAGFLDAAYEAAGAAVADGRRGARRARRWSRACSARRTRRRSCVPEGALLVALLAPAPERTAPRAARARDACRRSRWSGCRASRARSRWTCSRRRHASPATRRCCIGAAALPKFLPMLTTAAGNARAGEGVRHRRRRRRAAGHRHRAPARRRGLRVRRAPGGDGAGAVARRDASSRTSSSRRTPRRRAATRRSSERGRAGAHARRARRRTSRTWTSSSPRRRSPAGRRRGSSRPRWCATHAARRR